MWHLEASPVHLFSSSLLLLCRARIESIEIGQTPTTSDKSPPPHLLLVSSLFLPSLNSLPFIQYISLYLFLTILSSRHRRDTYAIFTLVASTKMLSGGKGSEEAERWDYSFSATEMLPKVAVDRAWRAAASRCGLAVSDHRR